MVFLLLRYESTEMFDFIIEEKLDDDLYIKVRILLAKAFGIFTREKMDWLKLIGIANPLLVDIEWLHTVFKHVYERCYPVLAVLCVQH